MARELRIKTALLHDGWAENVHVSIDDLGDISAIETGAEHDALFTDGCLIPGMANLHSHAHQRAMAGLAERAGGHADSFWTWRKIMYQFLDAIQPHQLKIIASQLYLEMLKSGYTHVAEFQYLHHQADGTPFDNVAEMSLQTLEAAREVGLGISNLPVHYEFGGFGGLALEDQQRRFHNNPDSFLSIVEALVKAGGDDKNVVTAIAAHSLRAITRASFAEVLTSLPNGMQRCPVHIHIAEQRKEVEDCLNWCGARPVEYLYDNFDVAGNWCLVHATHMNETETMQLAKSGAVAGLCPTTEGNLGDGFFNAALYLDADGRLGVGSDSHISVSPTEELRWFEYGQRLVHGSRNQLSGGPGRSTGRNLFDIAVMGGAQACGFNGGSIKVGKRADFVVLDTAHPLLCERDGDEILDSWIFSGNENPVLDVYVGGRRVVKDGRHAQEEQIGSQFRLMMKELRSTG
jgi:formimidoylglutamate deiminase